VNPEEFGGSLIVIEGMDGSGRSTQISLLTEWLESEGFAVETMYNFNKAGTPPWWAYSKVAGSRRISKPVLKLFDKTVWIWRRLDGLMPWNGLSLIVVARNKSGAADPPVECALNQQQIPASSN